MKERLKKYEEQIRYLVTGGWNTLFGYLAYMGLYIEFKRIIHYIPLLIISYVVSITNAYICYKIFVFKTKGNYLREYLRFYLVYGIAFLLNLCMLPLFVEIAHLDMLIAQAVITFVTVIISYVGHKKFSFRNSV